MQRMDCKRGGVDVRAIGRAWLIVRREAIVDPSTWVHRRLLAYYTLLSDSPPRSLPSRSLRPAMKSLRKSIGKDTGGPQISMPIAALSKPSTAVVPPKKVIRALQAYRPQAPTELPFQKGDFFYVIREVNVNGAWYEAHNPLSGARGLVPRALFDEFAKNSTTYVSPRYLSHIHCLTCSLYQDPALSAPYQTSSSPSQRHPFPKSNPAYIMLSSSTTSRPNAPMNLMPGRATPSPSLLNQTGSGLWQSPSANSVALG